MDDDDMEAIIGRQKLDNARTGADQIGNIVAELTCLSLLIDNGIASIDAVTQRLRQVPNRLPIHVREKEGAMQRIDFLVSVLQQVYGTKPIGWIPEVIQGGRTED
jgi:hypothetical protein